MNVPPIPKPPENPSRECKRRKVTVDYVCDDIKFADQADGVFAWPHEPAGADLEKITTYLIARGIASRGDDPLYEKYSRVRGRKVAPSDEPAINQGD